MGKILAGNWVRIMVWVLAEMVGGAVNLRALSHENVFCLLRKPSFLICLKKEKLVLNDHLEKRFETIG